MIQHRIARTSTEDIGVRVVALGWDGTPFDPSGYPVALLVDGSSEPPTATSPLWLPGVWAGGGTEWYAVATVGPGGAGGALDPGSYFVWVRITAPPTTPIIKGAFTLVVT